MCSLNVTKARKLIHCWSLPILPQDDHQLTSRNWKEHPLLISLNIENIEKETVTLTSTITLSDFILPKTDQQIIMIRTVTF